MSEDQVVESKPQEDLYPDPQFGEMVEAGLFYGRKRSRTNPRMKPYILTNRNEIEIINLNKTQEGLDAALAFLSEKVAKGGQILLVATQPPAEGLVAIAQEFNFPVVSNRWLGGTLTNFRIISTRIEHYKKLKADFAKNAFEKHTKKERLEIEREIERLTISIGGLEVMTRLPEAMVVIDANVHMTAVREARRMKIPVVAFVNTDCDPDLIDYPVVGNTKARVSIQWFFGKLRESLAAAKQMATQQAAAKQAAVLESQAQAQAAADAAKTAKKE